MPQHTPGPWRVSQTCNILANGQGEFPKMVAAIYTTNDTSPTYKDREERDANAHLIAAAPELLELLEQAFDRFTDNDMMPPNHKLREWLDRTAVAIAKARGEVTKCK
jgi:hypothetical protein